MQSFVVDTYAWIAYFQENEAYRHLIEENELKTPAIVFAELSRVLSRRSIPRPEIKRIVEFVLKRSVALSLDHEQAAAAGILAEQEGLALADAIVYSYCSGEVKLLSGDEHFRGKKNVLLVK